MSCIFFPVMFLLCTTDAVSGKADPYRELGSSFVLCPDSVTGPLTSITLKHGVDLAVVWSGDDVIYYRIFKGHCSLDTTSGCLTLYKVTHEHSGYYTPEINYELENPIEIKVISPVPKPTVSSDCNDEKTHCVLTCEGIITDDHGPVKFFWIVGDKYHPGNTLKITQENQERFISGVLENPVSFKQSENLPNPLFRGNGVDLIRVLMGVVLILLILIMLVLLWCLKRKEKLKAGEQNKTGRKIFYEPTVDLEPMQVTVDENSGIEPDYKKEKQAAAEDQRINPHPA